jgi:hypothetical protein
MIHNDEYLRREQAAREIGWAQQRERHERQMREQSQRLTGGGACFGANTPIATPSGERPIAELSAGDLVRSVEPRTGRCHDRRVLERRDHARAEIWEVATEEGRTVATTATHPFSTERGWVQCQHLSPADHLLTSTGARVRVTSAKATGRFEPVHNLITEGEHTFLAAGYVVHNYVWFRTLRVWLSRLLVETRLPRRAPERLSCAHVTA